MSQWPLRPLGELTAVQGGATPSKDEPSNWRGSIPWVSPKDMKQEPIRDSIDHVSQDVLGRGRLRLVPPDSILVVVRGLILARTVPLRRTAVPVTINQDIKALVPRPEVLTEFLRWALEAKHDQLLANVATAAHGTKKLDLARLLAIRVPVPPLSEQRRIVDILNRANGIRRLRREALDKARQLIPALFVEMFGDQRQSGGTFPTRPLREVADIGSGITKGRKLEGQEVVETPYVRVANVQDGFLHLEEIKTIPVRPSEVVKYALKAGDLLMTEGGDPDKLGRAALWNDEVQTCVHQNHVFRVRAKPTFAEPLYLRALAGSVYGKRYFLRVAKRTTGIASINKTQLGNFPVSLPPIGLQREFADSVADIQATIAQQERLAEASDQLVAALMAQLFDGSVTDQRAA